MVNDLGGDSHGGGASATPAQETVAMIKEAGGEAIVNGDNVAEWGRRERWSQQAIDTFGDLHVLVNNAGILRDRVIVNMTEGEWDAVINVHLKGHFARPTRRRRTGESNRRSSPSRAASADRSIIHTSSTSGIFSNPGQANYGAAKTGIATLSQICARSSCVTTCAPTRSARACELASRWRHRASATR